MIVQIASTLQNVIDNINRFAVDVEQSTGLQARLGYFRSWVFVNNCGEWRWGASKTVGYTTGGTDYVTTVDERDGRLSDAQLDHWFTEVAPNSALYDELSAALFAFLARYNKTPSAKMTISVLKKTAESAVRDKANFVEGEHTESNDRIVDLMVAVAKSLPAAHLAKLRHAIAA
jgi:hypothetical protein